MSNQKNANVVAERPCQPQSPSACAAETITGFAKENKLVTVVGTKTPGQVLCGTGFKMRHGFVLRIPVVTFHTWSGNALEGRGIEPDCAVDLSRESLREGHDTQLQKALELMRPL